jgi:hypothetical protein
MIKQSGAKKEEPLRESQLLTEQEPVEGVDNAEAT